jgi:gamma-glutamyltranspeptidase/glutathione hydrolase
MDDFSAKGVPNLYGLTGSEANSAPGKRMLSSMTPP